MFRPRSRKRLRTALSAIVRLLPLAILLSTIPGMLLSGDARAANGEVVVGHIDNTITPVMARYVERVIKRGERENAPAVVFEMDTPGGLGSAMDDIIRDILQSSVPVVVYVTPTGARAASAGVYIGYASHVLAMAPGTNIGSASPIEEGSSGSDNINDVTLHAKITNDAVAQITNLANLRGRNAQWAEQAVREAANVTADQALSLGVIDLIAPDLPTLLQNINGRTVQLQSGPVTLATAGKSLDDVGMSWIEQLLQLLSDPTIAYLLISFGLLGLYLELSHPGVTLPGVIGAISVLLGFFALGNIPVDWTGILLIGLAFLLFALDLFIASFGTLTIGGLVSFVLGSYLLVGNDTPGYSIEHSVIWAMTGCMLGSSIILSALVLRAKRRPPATGVDRLIGAPAIVRTTLQPAGMIMFNGELWNAHLASGAGGVAKPGDVVIVTGIKGLHATVRPATAADLAPIQSSHADSRFIVPLASAGSGGAGTGR
jgi:membrane-bound serine protease (ClpP class)